MSFQLVYYSQNDSQWKADVTLGLNIRTSEDTSTKANIVASAHAGDLLTIIEPNGWTKIGGINQWVKVRTKAGREGLAAAWYLEKVPGEVYPSTAGTASSPGSEAGVRSTAPAAAPLVIMVKPTVGKFGLKIHETASTKSKMLAKEEMRARLTVLEDAKMAGKKLGVAGKWLFVQNAGGVQGFVQAEYVKKLQPAPFGSESCSFLEVESEESMKSNLKTVSEQKQARVPVTVFRIGGWLDAQSEEQFLEITRLAHDEGARYLLIDMSDLDTLTSAGKRAIQKMYQMFTPPEESKMAHLKLCNAPPQIYNVPGITGFLQNIPMYESMASALESFGME